MRPSIARPITTAAAAGQGHGNYIPTNLAIVGAGTDVTVIGPDPGHAALPAVPATRFAGWPASFHAPASAARITAIPGGHYTMWRGFHH